MGVLSVMNDLEHCQETCRCDAIQPSNFLLHVIQHIFGQKRTFVSRFLLRALYKVVYMKNILDFHLRRQTRSIYIYTFVYGLLSMKSCTNCIFMRRKSEIISHSARRDYCVVGVCLCVCVCVRVVGVYREHSGARSTTWQINWRGRQCWAAISYMLAACVYVDRK